MIPVAPIERLPVLPDVHGLMMRSADIMAPPHHVLSGISLLMLAWLGVALSLLRRALVKSYRLRRELHRAQPLDMSLDPDIDTLPRGHIAFFQSSWDHSPLVFGFFKPRMILPVSWATWSAPCKRVVVAHEVAHIRQGDPWVYLLQTVAQALHFFNPWVWVLNRSLCQYSEMTCDDAAVEAASISRARYTEHLLHITQTVMVARRLQPAHLAVSAAYRTLRQRIDYQLSTRAMARTHVALRWGVIALLVLASIPFCWDLTSLGRAGASAEVRGLDRSSSRDSATTC